jgi:heme exporter protein A
MLLLNAVLWIMDEPFTALDAAGVTLVKALAEAHLERGGLVILTSHQAVTLGAGLRKLELQ